MAWQDNPIIKSADGTAYVVKETASSFPYAVVAKTADPQNKYDFDEVSAFWSALPDGDARKQTAAAIPPPTPPTESEMLDSYENSVAAYIQSFVRQRKYIDVADCVSYIHSKLGQRVVEAVYVAGKRDDIWVAWNALRAKVEAGTATLPTTWADVQALIPALAWPADYVPAQGDVAAKAWAARLVSTDTNNMLIAGTDGLMFVSKDSGE